jgi:hypothetical protein
MDPQRLSVRLQEAFEHRPRPEAGELVPSDVLHPEAEAVRDLLARKDRWELTTPDIKDVLTSELWMLTPKAFHYYLPALLASLLRDYESLTLFANEMVDALIRPEDGDADLILDRLDGSARPEVARVAASSVHELHDSGWPHALFRDRFGALSQEEGEAVLAFILAFREAYGEDLPFDELDVAIQRYWRRFATDAPESPR